MKKKQIKHSLERIKPIINAFSESLERITYDFASEIVSISENLTSNGIDADVMQAFIMHGIGVQIAIIKEKR